MRKLAFGIVAGVVDAPKNSKQHQIYRTKDGTRVPGVTTILGVLNKPALVPWANNLGLQGIKVREYVDDKAACGTLAHQMIADHLRKVATDTSDYTAKQIDQAENSVLSYFEWEKGKAIIPILVETPFVSPVKRFGGTIDCLALVNDVLTLIDFKTSKGIFDEMIYQVSAYDELLLENGYMQKQVKILRIGRDETEGFEEISLSKEVIEIGYRIFLNCLGIYEDIKLLKS